MTNKTVLVDIPNTLFDSRHREFGQFLFYHTGLWKDILNYSCLLLLKMLVDKGYKPIFTHYSLTRLIPQVEKQLKELCSIQGQLYCNFNTPDVMDNRSLKQYVYEHNNIDLVVDNDPYMRGYWLQNEVGLIHVPLMPQPTE